jgi:hypothetical protein
MRYTWFIILSLMVIGCTTTVPGEVVVPTSVGDEGPTATTADNTDLQAGLDQTETVPKTPDTGAGTAKDTAETQPEEAAAAESTSGSEAAGPYQAEVLDQVLFARSGGAAALEEIRTSADTRFVAGLIDSLRYRRDFQEDIGVTLNELTGQELEANWFEWVEWAGQNPEIASFDGYAGWKARLFSQIDPNFLRFVYPGLKVDPNSRVEEIVWGGVRVDGIPALDNPTMIDPDQADYLEPGERVFGVSINGDTRAYPARFLDWHEMFNDIVGGEPVSLAY